MMEQAHDPEQQIAERYFLGELDDAQAEAFEAHYFECPRCAEQVVETQMLFEAGRQVAREALPEKQVAAAAAAAAPVVHINERRRWQPWMANAAAAILTVVVGVQWFMPPPALRPTSFIVQPQELQMSSSRAETGSVPQFPVGLPVTVDFQVTPPEPSFPHYELFTRNTATRAEVRRHTLAAGDLNKPISLVLDHLPVGRYEVVIEGVREDGKRSTIDTSSFEVRGQQ